MICMLKYLKFWYLVIHKGHPSEIVQFSWKMWYIRNWNRWKINFAMFSFWDMCDFVLKFIKKFMFGVLPPLNPPFCRGFRPQSPDAFELNPHSQLDLGYHWFSGIDHISKTKNRTKKNLLTKKSVSGHCSSFEIFFDIFGLLFWWKHLKIVNKINHNSKNRNRKIDFTFVSAHCASFMKIGPFLRRGRGWVCICLLGTGTV